MPTYKVREEHAYPKADSGNEKFTIGEDEFIVDSEYRGANRLVIAIASPVYACGADTDDGTCSREVDSADERCWQHEDED